MCFSLFNFTNLKAIKTTVSSWAVQKRWSGVAWALPQAWGAQPRRERRRPLGKAAGCALTGDLKHQDKPHLRKIRALLPVPLVGRGSPAASPTPPQQAGVRARPLGATNRRVSPVRIQREAANSLGSCDTATRTLTHHRVHLSNI